MRLARLPAHKNATLAALNVPMAAPCFWMNWQLHQCWCKKLLRVIEYGHLERVGGSQPLRVDVRLVCATNDDLPALAAAGKFRADLLDRLAFDVVQLPPLRQRQQDIMLLAEHFAIQMCRELSLPLFPGFSEHAQAALLATPGRVTYVS